ncbi:apolipoprotein N-acyltransferase [Prochlorococcus sp. MIT 1341]|uniref:apolipoprotein N-acyltransferase n=1 Tax=Prochlorococcus sp. MIT 1341 TaxID=3096221 RepID=UPI002A747A96|nr:apolipoprotein N-acyltransferase [Prochlorococcus sp. MIT 1341]
MFKEEQSIAMCQGVLGGLLAGLAFFGGGIIFMPSALALLWSARRSSRASFFWGFFAVLISHYWLLSLHPLTWVGIPSSLSLPVAVGIWLLCGVFGGILVFTWALLGRFFELKVCRGGGEQESFWHGFVMSLVWGLAEVQLAKTPFFWIGVGSSLLPEDRILAGLARWVGSGGLATFQLLAGWLIWRVSLRWRNRLIRNSLLRIGLIVLLVAHGLGWFALRPVQAVSSISVGAWQSAVPIREKFSEEQKALSKTSLDQALKNAKGKGASVLVTPEGTISSGERLINPSPIPLLSGGFRWIRGQQRSSLLVFQVGEIAPHHALDKHRLVPLGEWVPFSSAFSFRGLSALGGLQPGGPSRLLNWQGPNAALAICYELSDGHLLGQAVKSGAKWLLTIANLDPYPIALHKQFIAISQLRSIESRRELISVANTGPSILVSTSGVVKHLLPSFSQGLAVEEVHLYEKLTIYTIFGEAPLILFLIVGIFFIFNTHDRY